MQKQKTNTFLYVILGILAFLFLANFGTTMMGYGSMMGGYSYGMMGLFGPLFMLLVLTALILATIWLYQQVQKGWK